jgi:hypothetical protein
LEYQKSVGLFYFAEETRRFMQGGEEDPQDEIFNPQGKDSIPIWLRDDDSNWAERIIDPGPGPYLPVWQMSPVFDGGNGVNENWLRSDDDDSSWTSFSQWGCGD